MVSRYVTNGPVKQEGICILPPPPPHYRMMPPQRQDTFHVATQQPYVPQPPPNQTGNQGPGIRGMAPTGPPTQSSTPPNSDLKVPQMSQQSMNITYVSQAPVRGGGQNFFSRGPPPQSQNPRMPNHRQSQQQMYQTQSAQYVAVQPIQPMYCTMPFYGSNAQRPTASLIPPFFPSQTIFPYPQSPQTPQTYMYNPQYIPRPGPPPQVASAPQNLTQAPPPTIPLTQSTQPHTIPRNKQRRAKAIPIIDPNTGKDKLNEMYEQDDSHPASGESSARQTPQPPYIPNKEVQNAFTKQVIMVMSQDKKEELDDHSFLSVLDSHVDNQNIYQTPPQAVLNMSRIDLVQSSKLQVPTKEFVPAMQPSTAKEITPVVSANTDAAEVTITKCNKDRESPAKSRKQREQTARENREVLAKDAPIIPEKSNKDDYKVNKDEYKYSKESVSPTPNAAPTKEVKELNNQREEKKNQKKDKMEQPKVPTGISNPEPTVENVTNPLPPPVAQDNGKSKSRSKDVQKQAQQQSVSASQKTTPPVVPIPQTQPSKPNNKTNKMRELNMKGANKEGTDMDAFNDNVAPPSDTINVNVTNSSNVSNDTFNANDISMSINDSNKRNESTDLPTIKSDIKTLPKSKIDITDIVKDVPKPLKPYIAPVEPQDETDRVELSNDKPIQPKYEASVKPHVEIEPNLDIKPSLPYKDDQWSPFNQDGKKIYDRDFLLALRNDPKSRKKPDNLLEVVAQEDRGKIGEISRYPMGVRTTDFVPNFGGSNYSSKSSSQRGVPPKRNSQQGKVGGGSKGKSNNLIKLSISVKEDVKLHETENAWKPARFIAGNNMSDEDKKTQELYRKVRGVLNKLTPQKFETLLTQVRSLAINNTERLQGVIDLVFEKAVDEPNFSVAYALMCRELALMQVPVSNDGKKKDEFVNFRKLLVTRCQLEFEKNSVDETARNEKLKEIEACADPEKKKEMQLLMEEEDRRIRRKSVGNIRFIGELFKQQMLTVNIMLRCLNNLLENKDEESLECLCKLLTTVGKEIDGKKVDIGSIFNIMKEIVDKKHGKISSRVRFMLQDVIDLRSAKWIPRRQDLNPKTMDQIQKEAETEHLNIQAMNSVPITPRKDDRGNAGPNADRKRNKNNPSDNDGWTSAPTRRCAAFTVQSDKLKNKPPQIDEPLGSSQLFGNWGRGSNIKTPAPPPPPNTGNMYAALENIGNETDKRIGLGSRSASKDPYNSKGPSLERNYKHTYEDGRGSRSGSQHRSNDNSQRSTPTPAPQQPLPKTNPPPTTKSRVTSDQITPELLELRLKNILEEYLNECCSVTECNEDIKTSIPPSALSQLVSDSYINVLERSKTARLRTASLFAQLIKLKTLSIDVYCIGLEEVLSQADDLKIDIPKIWDYLADVIAPVLCENVLPLNRLWKCCSILTSQGHSPKLLAPTFKSVVEEKGPNFLSSIWHDSNLGLSDFMPVSQVNTFIKENQFEFLLGGSNAPSGQSELTYEQIHTKLSQFFLNKNSFDDIINWINANVGDRIKENQFIRTLATAVFEDSIVNSKLKTETLRDHHKLLIRFVDSNPIYELQCLYALQALINKLEHPQGILLSICNSLYEENVFSHDSFVAWETSKDPAEQEGKGVALKQLTCFFTQLKEADEDSSSASEDA